MPKSAPVLDVSVALVGRDPETLDGLTEYLHRVGARPRSEREVRLTTEQADVVVLFGDDFEEASVRRFLAEWSGTTNNRSILVLVTSDPAAAEKVSGDPNAVVLRRPVWGWVLLGAIRTAMQRSSPSHHDATSRTLP
jgi:hypothetical protein